MNRFLGGYSLIVFVLLLSSAVLDAQPSSDPAPLKSTGTIPPDFITLSTEKYKKDVARTGDTSRVLRKNERDNFYLESNFLISDIFRSGKVLFNDTLGNYLNRIADRLLMDDPKLRNEVRIYVIMSDIPNAFTCDNGAIFMSIGLVSLCDNEAQIAFVLAHEITHYRKRHVIRQYINDIALEKSTEDIDAEGRLLRKANYSQDQESEADLEGLKLMQKAGYPVYESILALRKLDLYNTPFATDTVFMPSMLSIGAFNFSNYTVDYSEIAKEKLAGTFEEEREEYETHPAIPARCMKLLELASSLGADTNARFISTDYFQKMRRIARYELCRLYLLNGSYHKALYSAAILKTRYPRSQYLDNVIAKALYGFSMHNFNRRDGNRSREECGEDVYRVKIFLGSLQTSEVMLLSLSWNLHCYNTTSTQGFFARSVDLVTATQERHDKSLVVSQTSDTIRWLESDSSIINQMCMAETERLNLLPEGKQIFKAFNGKLYSEPRYEWSDRKDGEYALGIDTLIVLDPFYYRFQPIRKEGYEYRFIASEQGMAKFTSYISNCGEAADMQLNILSPYAMDSMSTESFNDMALLKFYFEARSQTKDSGLVSVDAEAIDTLCKKYNTEQIAIIGEFSVHTHRKKVGLIIASMILWPTLPLGIAYAVSPTYDAYSYVGLYDIPTGQRFQKVHYTRQRDTRAGVSSSLYYTLLQIRNKPKK